MRRRRFIKLLHWGNRLYIAFAVLTLFAYTSPLINPARLWVAGFISFTIPFVVLTHAVSLVAWLAVPRMRMALVSLLMLALAIPYFNNTLALNSNEPIPAKGRTLKVISYNVRLFKGYGKTRADHIIGANHIYKWLDEQQADVVCIQEFYNQTGSYVYNSLNRIGKSGYVNNYFVKAVNAGRYNVGMAIFSKYPTVHREVLYRDSLGNNQIMFVDLRLPTGILRVYNIHLRSLRIRGQELVDNDTREEVKRNARSIGRKLKQAFMPRMKQLAVLEANIAACPYPVIVCGDLNETPYSYTYYRLNRNLNNAFEEAGKGFGFSFNGPLPGLRIDNQFADRTLPIYRFTTHRKEAWSDHFPISAIYGVDSLVKPN